MKLRLTLFSMALASASLSQAASTYTPVAIQPSSYNQDAIVESNATPVLKAVTTASVDSGTANTASTWYEIGYDSANPTFGLPAANTVVTARDNANYTFRMPPSYTANNGILIDTAVTTGTFTLTAPAAYNRLSFACAGGNGGDVIGVQVNHADSTFETLSFGCPDWFSGSGVIIATQGRMNNNITHAVETDGDNPRIYFRDIVLSNTNSAVTSIVLTYVSGQASSHNDIMAVSGATTPGGPVGPIAVTGYTYDFVVEATAAKRAQLVSQTIVAGTNVFATSQTMDNDGNTGFAFYEKGYNFNLINNLPYTYGNPGVDAIAQSSGIPRHGTTFTNATGDHVFTMAPDYTTNDVVWLSPTVTNATITFVTPTAASALSFLDAAGNGPVVPSVVIHHQNGNSETNTITIVDWFSGITPIYIPNGRVDTGSGQFSQVTSNNVGADRLFSSDIPVADPVSPITSIDLIYTNTVGGRAGIFAVSATAGAVAPIFTLQPVNTNLYAGNTFGFVVQASGTAPITFQWQKGTNGVFVNLNNGGNVSGATTSNLTVTAAVYPTDGADYRVIASNAGGSVISSVATATLFTTGTDVTQPGDPITSFGTALFGDGAPSHIIDNDLGTKFGANVTGPCGVVITPNAGPTIVTGMRFYTANDSTGRDPADYKLEGSINGGASYTLIASNLMTLPDGRNTAGALDPLVTFVKEVSFPNTNGYTSYRLTFSHYKGDPGQTSCQLGDLELLGVTTTLPVLVTAPANAKAFVGSPLTITATASGSPTPTARWQKQIGGVFTDLTDAGTISGSHTTSLTINPTAYSDIGQFRLIATNTAASVTSSVVQVMIFSTAVDITVPTDVVTDFGNTSPFADTPAGAVDNTFSTAINHGSGQNNGGGGAGFPPFAGPVGLVITPAASPTVLSGIRFYTGTDGIEEDPADFKLEGSDNGGVSYTTLVPTTALSLPLDRNDLALAVDPLSTAVQEIHFSNSQAHKSYRLTFNNTRDNSTAIVLSIGEIELLGVQVPTITSSVFSGGNLNITGSGGTPGGSFSVLASASVTAPLSSWTVATTGTFDFSGGFTASLPVNLANPARFFVIKIP